LLERLTGGPDTATNLVARLPMSRQAVVKHLQVLADAGLVTAERHGREVRYAPTPAPLRPAVAWMEATGAAWDRRLARLRERMAERSRP
jgi:DNA-binding transcriptional ArsR family regulator